MKKIKSLTKRSLLLGHGWDKIYSSSKIKMQQWRHTTFHQKSYASSEAIRQHKEFIDSRNGQKVRSRKESLVLNNFMEPRRKILMIYPLCNWARSVLHQVMWDKWQVQRDLRGNRKNQLLDNLLHYTKSLIDWRTFMAQPHKSQARVHLCLLNLRRTTSKFRQQQGIKSLIEALQTRHKSTQWLGNWIRIGQTHP